MFIPPYVLEVLNLLESHGFEAFVVGGAIRNYLLNLPAHDYDVTTNALPLQIKEVFHKYHTIDTGIQHGTVTVMVHHKPIEITTYRKDNAYKDHRHPTNVTYTTSLQEDCKRRDFTINAMCYSPSTGILDFFNGQEDLKEKKIRCIGNPEERFEEDALRILRALRFASRLGFSIDEETSNTLRKKKDTLSYVSKERITSEWMGILESSHPVPILQNYREVIEICIPEIKEYTETEYSNVLDTIQRDTSNSSVVRMALFLRPLETTIISKILRNMKCSNNYSQSVLNLLQTSTMPSSSHIELRYVLNQLKVDFSIYLSYQQALQNPNDLKKLYDDVTHDSYAYSLSQLEITGADLISEGFKGKEIGTTLKELLELVIQEKLPNNKNALLDHLHH